RRKTRSREWGISASWTTIALGLCDRRFGLRRLHKFVCVAGSRHFAEQAEEVCRGLAANLVERNAARFGQDFRSFDHESRFIALAAIFSRRQVGRVGLDQDPV